ncbi:MAG: hypothetical protein CBC35_09215 [Planctomycetes bacterium TMED75]|nr:MAG: hypothetical protein CBC35_09215 [Planctomycetes bacterium TMED75]
MAHVLLLAFAFLVTWSVVDASEDDVESRILAPPPPRTFEPVSTLRPTEPVRPAASLPAPRPTESRPETVQVAEVADLIFAADDLLLDGTDLAGGEESSLPGIDFGGVGAPAARRIVFVVDASGSMIGAYPAVIDQVEGTLRRLVPRQSFSVVLFRAGGAEPLPTDGRLRAATTPAIDEAADWMRGLRPEGRSDPAAALRKAFAVDPEVVYLVSTDITGAGVYEIDGDALIELLDELNPAADDGRRQTVIRCIQLLDEDRLGTLRRIARMHGGDARESGFAFIGREALGLDR